MEKILETNVVQEKKSLAELIAEKRGITVEEAQAEIDQIKTTTSKTKKGFGSFINDVSTVFTIAQAAINPIGTAIIGSVGLTAHRLADSLNSEKTHPGIWKKFNKSDERIAKLEDRLNVLEIELNNK